MEDILSEAVNIWDATLARCAKAGAPVPDMSVTGQR